MKSMNSRKISIPVGVYKFKSTEESENLDFNSIFYYSLNFVLKIRLAKFKSIDINVLGTNLANWMFFKYF